jgi:hypothetical protein
MNIIILPRVRMSERSEFRTLEYKVSDTVPRIHNARYSAKKIYILPATVMPSRILPHQANSPVEV